MSRINYRHYICIAITLGFLACSVFVFPNALGRIIESGRDIGLSLAYYICEVFNIDHSITPTVIQPAVIPFFNFISQPVETPAPPLSDTFEGFQSQWVIYWQAWASKANFFGYVRLLSQIVMYAMQALTVLLPICILVWYLFKRWLTDTNLDYDIDSKPLKGFIKLSDVVYRPTKMWLAELIEFIRNNSTYIKLWLFIWAWNFNIITIALEAVAYYIYFSSVFDFVNLYMQVYKLAIDLAVPLTFIPVWAWILIALYLLNRYRKARAISRLWSLEYRNRDFVSSRPITSLVCTDMGGGKTTMVESMAQSAAIMQREDAYKEMIDCQMKFPHFHWATFEQDLQDYIEGHGVYTLASCRKYVRTKQKRYEKSMTVSLETLTKTIDFCRRRGNPLPDYIFGYDYLRYGMTFDDKLKVVTLWDILEIYAQVYYIYTVKSSLIYSNFAIRTDNKIDDNGNLPTWNTDFLSRDSRKIPVESRYSHILDMDMMRLGKKVKPNNPNKDVFEFGVIAITEVGKERGNIIDHKRIEKDENKADKANQLNDMFNPNIKMARHKATIANKPYVKIFMDEQRPESLGADVRELADIIHIVNSSDMYLAMPFFAVEELLYTFIFKRFVKLYTKYRHNRGDNTLRMHIIKTIVAKFHNYYTSIYNCYGYKVISVEVENGKMDSGKIKDEYYILPKKDYSDRFATDCLGGFFAPKAERSPRGITDVPEYAGVKATMEELDGQDSFFVMDMKATELTEAEPAGEHSDPKKKKRPPPWAK